MRAGRLRHIVVFKRLTGATNDYGEQVQTWTEIGTCRAAVEPLNGKEYFAKSGENTEVTTRIRVRYDAVLSTLKPSDRAEHGTVIYDIKAVINPSEKNRELVLMCERDG